MLSIGWMAAAVPHNPGCLLALDIVVHARHPGTNLVHELALPQDQNVIGPFADTGWGGFDPRQPALRRVPDHACHPVDAVFRSACSCQARHAAPSPSACSGICLSSAIIVLTRATWSLDRRPCFVCASMTRVSPSGVRGPVLSPPCNRHLFFPLRATFWQGVP